MRVARAIQDPTTITDALAAHEIYVQLLLKNLRAWAKLLGFFAAFATLYDILLRLINDIWAIISEFSKIPEGTEPPNAR